MSDIDDEIDRLYQGPLEAFTGARNALAKSTKRADLKELQKPSLPAWVVNQLHWHRQPLIDRLVAAGRGRAPRARQGLAGKPADVRAAEQAQREIVKEALAAAREVLAAGGHPATPATLEAIRETLQALPSPEATGRSDPRLVAARLRGAGRTRRDGAGPAGNARRPAAEGTRPHRAPPAGAKQTHDRETARAAARAQAERERRRREEQQQAAKEALDTARAALKQAEAALAEAERETMKRRTERNTAADAVEKALKAFRE